MCKNLSLIKSLHEISVLDKVKVTVGSFFILAYALDHSCNVLLWFLLLCNKLQKENHAWNLYSTDAIPSSVFLFHCLFASKTVTFFLLYSVFPSAFFWHQISGFHLN